MELDEKDEPISSVIDVTRATAMRRINDLMRNPANRVYGRENVEQVTVLWVEARLGGSKGDEAVLALSDFYEEYPPPEDWLHRTRLAILSQVNRGRLDRELPLVDYAIVEALLSEEERRKVWPVEGASADLSISQKVVEGIYEGIHRRIHKSIYGWVQIVIRGESFKGKVLTCQDTLMELGHSITPYFWVLGGQQLITVDRKFLLVNGKEGRGIGAAEYQFSYKRME